MSKWEIIAMLLSKLKFDKRLVGIMVILVGHIYSPTLECGFIHGLHAWTIVDAVVATDVNLQWHRSNGWTKVEEALL